MTAEQKQREALEATIAKVRDGLAQAVEGLTELLNQFAPHITQADLDLLTWTPFKSGSGEWCFTDRGMDPDEEPEEVKRTRERVVAYVRAKGGSAFVGKWQLSISKGKRGDVEFLSRKPVKR